MTGANNWQRIVFALSILPLLVLLTRFYLPEPMLSRLNFFTQTIRPSTTATAPLQQSVFRNMAQTSTPSSVHQGPEDSWHGKITTDGPFQPEKGRYHLYIGLFCPFAHRANLVRHLKGLQDFIDISIVKPYPKGNEQGWPGWQFPKSNDEYPNATVDNLFGSKYLHEVYFKADKDYKGRYSVPTLWDKKLNTIVNNVGHAYGIRVKWERG